MKYNKFYFIICEFINKNPDKTLDDITDRDIKELFDKIME